jgi:hypothetical protein
MLEVGSLTGDAPSMSSDDFTAHGAVELWRSFNSFS